jgi:gamma-glutamyl-gamma-aminobutyrate hydrolase PuuD
MITIGFTRATDEERYQLYLKWLKSIDPSFEYINFYKMDKLSALGALDECSGLVLTRGADIHPSHYGKGEEVNKCECDPPRDMLEFANAVQWHPEKGDYYDALSQAIAKDFIDKVNSFKG